MPKNAWLGMAEFVEHYLTNVMADKGSDGRFKIWGDVTVGLGGEELVIHDSAEFEIKGRRCNLAEGLRSTSEGVGVQVLC